MSWFWYLHNMWQYIFLILPYIIECDYSWSSYSTIILWYKSPHQSCSPIDPLSIIICPIIANYLSFTFNCIRTQFWVANHNNSYPQKNPTLSVANYLVIPKLSTHQKILEGVLAKQLIAYMIFNKIPSIFQRGYLNLTRYEYTCIDYPLLE